MFATRPSRYYVEWESSEEHARLKARAIKRGTYTEDCDDWFEPADVLDIDDGFETLAAARRVAEQHAAESLYGEARIYERKGIVKVGEFFDCGEPVHVETV